jgi:hypothetical protein
MGRSAHLTTIDAVDTLAAVLESFRHDSLTALDELKMELRRAGQWVHQDRRLYWDHEVRRSWEGISQARVDLQQAMTVRRMGDHDPACVDEKKALERAKRRLAVAEQKIEAVRHWAQTIDRAMHDFEAACAQLTNLLETDVPQGLAVLRHMSQNLEAYLAVRVVDEPALTTPATRSDEATPPAVKATSGQTEAVAKEPSQDQEDSSPQQNPPASGDTEAAS